MNAATIVNQREPALDLLRILSMIMVVCLHCCNHGGLVEGALVPGTVNYVLGNTVFALAFVSVNCFVLLSGYFQCTSRFKLSRAASTWLQAFFYSVLFCLVINIIYPGEGISLVKELIKSGMVVSMSQYWFVTAYLLMYAVSPFLNCAIQAMDRTKHLLCCMVLIGIFSVAHNIVYINDFGGVRGGSSFLWFCIIYMIAAYFRLYRPQGKRSAKGLFFAYLLCALVTAAERVAAQYITPMIFGRVVLNSLFFSYNSIFTLAASCFLFLCFRELSISNQRVCRIISAVAPLAFGVYLIHDNRFVRPILWESLNPAAYAESPWLFLYMALCVIGIFAICCVIEKLRQIIFTQCRINALVKNWSDKVQSAVLQRLETNRKNKN